VPFVELTEKIAQEEKHAHNELFVKAYRQKYTCEQHLPIWMATELMTMGTLSMMFEGLKSVTKTKIAAEYKLAEVPFQNWMHVLATIRNFGAHHSRLWNRQLGVQAKIPHDWIYRVPHTDRVYCVVVMMHYLLGTIAPNAKWKHRFIELMNSHPGLDLTSMGFPADWRTISPWV
jgi:abortive infection bacteriophage resistance protein